MEPLAYQFITRDPFLSCVHHDDRYPAGNDALGPSTSLEGRKLGDDFESRDGFRMYNGKTVPGFSRHAHRGFETITIVRRGLVDYTDSLGVSARYGEGDVQWLTAGRGIVHAEMFPLTSADRANPVELFQIWLNLPRARKLCDPRFTMLWSKWIPKVRMADDAGRETEITILAGGCCGTDAPKAPVDSWAADPKHDVAIWILRMAPRARWQLPATHVVSNRTLYFFAGSELSVGGFPVQKRHQLNLTADIEVMLESGADEAEVLLLQGRPIDEPVVRHGPFVMNSREEIQQAYSEYSRTDFGKWRWPSDEPVHAREEGRFVRRADGTIERPS